jgi:hypothetical protein
MFLYILFFGLLTYLIFKSTQKPDKFPPGPPKLPVIGSLPYLSRTGSFAHTIIKIVNKYGPVTGFFLGNKPIIIVADYAILKGKQNIAKSYQSRNSNILV